MTEFRFKAFISYSHHNDKIASRLLRKLEGYRVPEHLSGRDQQQSVAPKNLGKIFRDREELSASGCLDAKLLDAIKQSEFLIVVCSPHAAGSDRVNEEITQFIKHRDSTNILCYIVDGEPQFGTVARSVKGDCVPPSLRKLYLQSGQIPVAADAREVGDGPVKALQKIVAGLLNVELDELVQRDVRRHQNRLMMITAASILFALFTIGLLVRANIAEDAAQRASLEARLQNDRAEDLIHFMLEDLASVKLQQVGRLDVIDAVVEKVATHYSREDDNKLGSVALARKALAYLKLGRVYFGRNMHEPADELFEYAYRTTTALTQRFPESEEAVFAHIRSLYWIGLSNMFRGQYTAAEKAWRERVSFGEILLQSDEHSEMVWSALGDIYVHLGWALMEMGRIEEAYVEFKKGLKLRQENAMRFRANIGWLNNLAGGYYHVQWAELYLGKNELAFKNAIISNETYKRLTETDPTDQRARGNYARSLRWRAEAEIANQEFGQAEKYLRESVEVHKSLLDFEPKDTTFQYQACVSSVMLVEVLVASGQFDAADMAARAVCDNASTIIALDHPVVHNRLYGYRNELANIRLALETGHLKAAAEKQEIASSQFENESIEIQQSLQGRRISLTLAIDAVELNNRANAMPDAPQHLSHIVAEIESTSVHLHSVMARLLARARRLTAKAVGVDATASLSIEK